jgi:hypothetical protein
MSEQAQNSSGDGQQQDVAGCVRDPGQRCTERREPERGEEADKEPGGSQHLYRSYEVPWVEGTGALRTGEGLKRPVLSKGEQDPG